LTRWCSVSGRRAAAAMRALVLLLGARLHRVAPARALERTLHCATTALEEEDAPSTPAPAEPKKGGGGGWGATARFSSSSRA